MFVWQLNVPGLEGTALDRLPERSSRRGGNQFYVDVHLFN